MTSGTSAPLDPSTIQDTWRDGRATSTAIPTLVPGLFAAAVWGALTGALVHGTRRMEGALVSPWTLLTLLFVVVEIHLLVYSASRLANWFRFGRLELVLDPFPASPGGHAGGSVAIPLRPMSAGDIVVTLSCIRSERRGQGRSSSRWESVVWAREMHPRVEPAPSGSRLRFTFQVPEGLPPSEEAGRTHHHWAVRIRAAVPGVDLDRSFAVPVVETAEPALAERPALGTPTDSTRYAFPESIVRVRRLAAGVELEYPAARGRPVGLIQIFFALFFTAFGSFLTFAQGAGPTASTLSRYVFMPIGGAFYLMAVLLALLGLYNLLNTLAVRINRQEVLSTRSILGIRRSRRLAVEDIAGIHATITSQSGQGQEAVVRLAIRAKDASGVKVTLGDGLLGSEMVEALAGIIERSTGKGVSVP